MCDTEAVLEHSIGQSHNDEVAVGPVALAGVSVDRGLAVWPLSSGHHHHVLYSVALRTPG